ncbi:hypothetical protein K3495_g574 [Podosphaera aphanis]|nr:hypothetical protein K3495_g574 [Podosphaera aphanis]
MPPAKRKRGDRQSIDIADNRPSPYRPQNLSLGQHEMRDGTRRLSRGGQGGSIGRGARRNDIRDNPNQLLVKGRATPTPGPMSPPMRPSSANHTPAQTPTQTPINTPTPIIDNIPAVSKNESSPFEYLFLTEERLYKWGQYGRDKLIASGIQARKDEDTTDLGGIFQELIRSTLDGRLDPVIAGNCVKEILGPDTHDNSSTPFDPQTFFLDVLSMICETNNDLKSTPLRAFTFSTGVSPTIMRQKLDGKLLQDLSLTRETFVRVGVRQATNLLYRQANYNLLREETEGYAKLVAELFTTSESERPTSEAVEDAFERVKALIGTFDLDVGRVLDITLDVFASILIKHYRFFIKLLRVSSWWPRNAEADGPLNFRHGGLPNWGLPSSPGFMPTEEDEQSSKIFRLKRDKAFWNRARQIGLDAFFELSGAQVVDIETRDQLLAQKAKGLELDPDKEWIAVTGTLPPPGNYVAAQLLGFKLRFYTSDARDKEDVLPPNLMYLTALLIKIGFISLRDLYPHLWPLDEAMPAVREAKLKELEEKERLNRPGGGMNALMMAGALPDDTLPPSRNRESANIRIDVTSTAVEAEDKDKLEEPTDQKVLLLVCLLTIGAIPESLFILGRFPWLPEAYPELIELINRILNYSIKDVYQASSPIHTDGVECPPKKVPEFDQSGMPKGQLKVNNIPARKQLRWPFPDKFDTNENLAYRFYWDEWTDNIPVCQSIDDIFTLCGTFLNLSGVNIGKDAALLSKLARIGTKSLAEDQSQHNLDRWQDLLKRLLVPALSLTKANTSLGNLIYDMLRFYPLPIRFSIYAEWFEGQTSRLPAIKTAFARAKLETQSIMKRISLTNLTQMAKSLAKTGYACPGVVFSIALSQIEAYTNLTQVVVECAKYFTDLGYDILDWSLLSALGGKSRNRNNPEYALLPSRWLLALSSFAGKVYRRYGIMSLSPIIQYVNDQLYKGNATDLVILKELISQMAGIVSDTDFTDAQLVAMTGGEALRRQTLISLQDKRFESTKTAKRLMRSLTDTNISGELLIAIAQHRQSAIYKIPEEEAHIKLLATMIDDTQSIMSQYLDLLRSNLSVKEFDKQVPGIPQLLIEFGLEPALAFMIGRGSIAHRISKILFSKTNINSEQSSSKEQIPAVIDAEGDVSMVNEEKQSQKLIIPKGDTMMENVEMDEVHEALAAASPISEEIALPSDSIQEILEPIITSVKSIIPEDSFRGVTPEFYVTFWISTLSDFSIPNSSYEMKVQELLNQVAEIGKDRSDMTRQGMVRKEEMTKTLNIAREAVLKEFAKAIYSYPHKKAHFLKQKAIWFNSSVKADEMSDFLLEKCIIPRLILSPSDADFCFRLIKLLHDNGVPHFRTLSLYGRIFRANRLRSLIFSCTIREAENLGRFLRLVLADLARWHADSAVYEKEAWGSGKVYPGFAKSLDADGKPKALLEHDGNPGFKHVCFGWQKALNTALRDCLDGTEWMHIRNAVTILKSVVEVFPAVDFMGNSFIKQLEAIAKREQKVREDLSLTSNATLVQLKKRSKRWVMVQAYGNNLVGTAQINGTSKPAFALNTKLGLRPNAPEFKSDLRSSSLSLSTSKTTTEVEDGEVDDAKTAGAPNFIAHNNSAPEPRVIGPPAPVTMESRKSEILDRREQIKRENAAKISVPSSSSVPPRPEPPRGSIPERVNHSLPSRPDSSFSTRDLMERHIPRNGDRRDIRNQDQRSLERPARQVDRPREFSSERRSMESTPRDYGRSDRLGSDRERSRPEPHRWNESLRDNSDRTGTTRIESGRLSRENPVPRTSVTATERGASTIPDRVLLINPERQERINLERAALISSEKDTPRSNSPRRARDEDPENKSPRPKSPRRHASEKTYDSRWDERSTRVAPSEIQTNHSRSRKEDGLPPPAGPRSDRSNDRERSSATERSQFPPPPALPTFIPPDHARINLPTGQQADPNFGRLNPAQSSADIPSGPRDVWISRGNRMGSAPSRHDNRMAVETHRPPTPERQPPTGPSSRHHRRGGSNGPADSVNPASIPLPMTPSTLSPVSGIHPDRLKSLGTSIIQHTPAHQPPPIHPDRLRVLGETPIQPSPNQSNRPRTQTPITPTLGPPSGPKGSISTSSGPASNSLTAPTGPASASERAARGTRRQLAGINTMLQQAGQQSNSDRSNIRGRRLNSSISGQETTNPVTFPSLHASGPQPTRHDSTAEHERTDLITGGVAVTDERDRDRNGRRERSGRHSQRSSRSPAREREFKRGMPEDERGYRERNTRRGEERDLERDARHAARLSGEELIHSTRERDRERVGRRDVRERDLTRDQELGDKARSGDTSRGGRSRDFKAGEDRRDSRGGRAEDGRKRHGEDGGIDSRKRIRRA